MAYVQVDQEIRVQVVKEEMVRPSNNGSREGESRVVEQMFVSAIDLIDMVEFSSTKQAPP